MCLYYKIMESTLIIVGVYVDDLLVPSNEASLVDEFFDRMKAFDFKALAEQSSNVFGYKIECETPGSYCMSQRLMILNLIEQFGLKQAKPVGTPIADVAQSANDMDPLSAQDVITRCTRPDIGFAVHQMTTRTHAPRMCDYKLGKRILRYLVGTSDYHLDVLSDSA
jgi:hypothetical protein